MSKGLIFVDVEATGLTPASGKMTEFGAVHYDSMRTFHGKIWNSKPDPKNPAKPIITGRKLASERRIMLMFDNWIQEVTGSTRPIFVSDNPAYDFMWIAVEFDRAMSSNPFGHSARRIGDYYAGLVGDFYTSQKWKNYRQTVHDHNPVNDAMGNVEAMKILLERGA